MASYIVGQTRQNGRGRERGKDGITAAMNRVHRQHEIII